MKLSLPLAFGGFHASRWVGAGPGHVGGRAVARRDRLAQQPQGDAELRPVMRRVKHAPPEDPYALALKVKEWDHLKPPGFLPVRQTRQPGTAQFFIAAAKG